LQNVKAFIAKEKPDVIIFEDYNKGILTSKVIQDVIGLSKKAGVLTSVDPKRKNFFSYRGVDVSANGVPWVTRGKMLMVTVSNGRWLGGAFKIAPSASVTDGLLDACFIGDSNVVQRIKLFAGALRGTHLELPSVKPAQVQQLTLAFPGNPSMEIDGELRVARSQTVDLRCVPRALAVLAAPGALS
jgi:hypothetical protein